MDIDNNWSLNQTFDHEGGQGEHPPQGEEDGGGREDREAEGEERGDDKGTTPASYASVRSARLFGELSSRVNNQLVELFIVVRCKQPVTRVFTTFYPRKCPGTAVKPATHYSFQIDVRTQFQLVHYGLKSVHGVPSVHQRINRQMYVYMLVFFSWPSFSLHPCVVDRDQTSAPEPYQGGARRAAAASARPRLSGVLLQWHQVRRTSYDITQCMDV